MTTQTLRAKNKSKLPPDAPHDYATGVIELKNSVTEHILEMDKAMKGPSTFERGQHIARLVCKLQDALLESFKYKNVGT
jgi:hypothetical protein